MLTILTWIFTTVLFQKSITKINVVLFLFNAYALRIPLSVTKQFLTFYSFVLLSIFFGYLYNFNIYFLFNFPQFTKVKSTVTCLRFLLKFDYKTSRDTFLDNYKYSVGRYPSQTTQTKTKYVAPVPCLISS